MDLSAKLMKLCLTVDHHVGDRWKARPWPGSAMELGEGVGDPLPPLPPLPSSLTSLLASSSRLVLSDSHAGTLGVNAYRPWEPAPDAFYHVLPPPHPSHLNPQPHHQPPSIGPPHPSPHACLTPLTPSHVPPSPMAHYGSPPVSTVFSESYPHPSVGPPPKLPPFSALSPERNAGGASPLPSFSTLPSPHARYPLVPAPVQARDIPTVQQQMMDERHIHMFESPQGDSDPSSTTPGHPSPSRGAVAPPALTPTSIAVTSPQSQPQVSQPQSLQQQFENGPIISRSENVMHQPQPHSRRGRRIGCSGSAMRQSASIVDDESTVTGTENCGQVSSVSSTAASATISPAGMMDASFRSPQSQQQSISQPQATPPQPPPPPQDDPPEKPVKKKRKRCGDCVGCQRKDNCGDCAPCRNDKSHQICKMRRCDKLTEKRVSN
ncbi:UNVERIFIED_CONTAM: hypothetical protein RMT77_001914 [Armadillidium vulgare]